MAINLSDFKTYDSSEESMREGVLISKFKKAFMDYLEPLKKVYKAHHLIDEKFSLAQEKLVNSKWNDFIAQVKALGIVFEPRLINSFLSLAGREVYGDSNMKTPEQMDFFKLMIEKLFKDNYTQKAMIEFFYSPLLFPSVAKQFLSVYYTSEAVSEFFKDKNLSRETIKVPWVLDWVGLQSPGKHLVVDYLIDNQLVLPIEFFDESKYASRFNLLDSIKAREIMAQLDLSQESENQALQNFLANSCTDRSCRIGVVEYAFNLANNFGLEFPLERIIALRIRANMEDDNYYQLYELVKLENVKTLLFLIDHDFLPGANRHDMMDLLKAKVEKQELIESLEADKINQFLKQEGLEEKFNNFLDSTQAIQAKTVKVKI